jgi:hypothetical protein
MPNQEVICPACSSRLQPPASLRAGDLMECPMCATEFALGGHDERLTNRPPSPRRQGDDEEEGRRVDLEIVEDDEPRVRKRSRRGRRPQSGSVELTRWISLGFTHWFPMLPPSIGFFFVYILIYIGATFVIGCLGIFLRRFPVVGNMICLFLLLSVMVPLSAGMTLVCVQQLLGRRWSFGDFFSGQQWWLPIVGNYVLLQILYFFLCLGPPMVLQLVLRDNPIVLLLGWGFSAFIYLLLYPLTWMFSWQLMLDGNYGPVEAITENVQMAIPHYVKLLPLAALTLLIRLLGVMLCGVGFAAAWPLAVLIESTAYLRLTGRRVAESPSEIN